MRDALQPTTLISSRTRGLYRPPFDRSTIIIRARSGREKERTRSTGPPASDRPGAHTQLSQSRCRARFTPVPGRFLPEVSLATV